MPDDSEKSNQSLSKDVDSTAAAARRAPTPQVSAPPSVEEQHIPAPSIQQRGFWQWLHGICNGHQFDAVHHIAEVLSFVALIVGVPFALIDLHNKAVENQESTRKQRLEAAEAVYREVDQRYIDFMRACLDHPRLDCYSTPRVAKPPLNETEIYQQKIMYSALTDLFEVAYTQYHKQPDNPEIKRLYYEQWSGWDNYIRKFVNRPAYRDAWFDMRDEYDGCLVSYMDSIVPPKPGSSKPTCEGH